MFKRVKTAERVEFAVVHPQVASQVVGAGQVHSAIVTELAVVVLKRNEIPSLLVRRTVLREQNTIWIKKSKWKTHQQISWFARDTVVVEIVRRVNLVVVRGRAVGGVVFEHVRQRSGLHPRG